MSLKLNLLPFPFPSFKKINTNSTILKIIKPFFIAFLISNSIYISFFPNSFLETLSPFVAIYGFVLLLKGDKKIYFFVGFYLGILWFWWLGLSSIYFGLSYIIPLEVLGVGLFYGVCFRICHLLKFDFLRLCGIFLLSYVHPLGFDWLNWGILSVYGFFDTNLKGVICIFIIAYLFYERFISRYYKIVLILICFFTGMQYEDKKFEPLDIDFSLVNTQISQDKKYLKENISFNSQQLVENIEHAIVANKKLIIMPESAFPFILEEDFDGRYYAILQELSYKIAIVVGTFHTKDDAIYNSTYVFKDGKEYIFDKHYLVPFGEEIPFLKTWFKRYLMPSMQEFSRGNKLNQYLINDQVVTNAICYEATKEENFKHSKIMIAISNNAWFDYSSEYLLQKLLIKFYASKYGVVVYHSTNGKETGVIEPKKALIKQLIQGIKDLKDKFFTIFSKTTL